MKELACAIATLFFLSLGALTLRAQNSFVYHLNATQGLPSNHVYGYIYDRLGYLWLCTPNGVAKYNGYECKIFDQDAGMLKEDVWQLLEDKKGRIWLGTISNQIGYIENNKYRTCKIDNKNKTIRPDVLVRFDSGVAFTAPFLGHNHNNVVCVSDGDSIKLLSINYKLTGRVDTPRGGQDSLVTVFPFISSDSKVYFVYRSGLYKYTNDDSAQFLFMIDTSLFVALQSAKGNIRFYKDLLIVLQKPDPNSITLIDLITRRETVITLPSHIISHVVKEFRDRLTLVIATLDSVYACKIDYNIEWVERRAHPIKARSLMRVDNMVLSNALWGSSTILKSNGLALSLDPTRAFRPSNLKLFGFNYLGLDFDSRHYWFNKDSDVLIVVHHGEIVDKRTLPKGLFTGSIVQPDSEHVWFLCDRIITYEGRKRLFRDYSCIPSPANKMAVFTEDGNMFSISNFIFSLSRFENLDIGYRMVKGRIIDKDRYSGIGFCKNPKEIFAYNINKFVRYNIKSQKLRVLSSQELGSLGIQRIDQIAQDRFYNMFLVDNGRMLLTDDEFSYQKEVFPNLNLKNAIVRVESDFLVVAGKFGVAVSRILGSGQLSEPALFPNIKQLAYQQLDNIEAFDSSVVLFTNVGSLRVDFTKDFDDYQRQYVEVVTNYKMIVEVDGREAVLSKGDTIVLGSNASQIQFDAINPQGSGKLKFLCKYPSRKDYVNLFSKVLSIGTLQSGQYYTYTILATDDVWKSQPLTFVGYITPTWWESMLRSKAFYVGAAVLFILLIVLIVYVTRRVVTESNKRKNLRQDIELKSVYSQINPHFIFNSLNTSLYFIKKNRSEEAFSHVSKFAYLLRSYISSSRNKFITVAEEMNNLETYILLQQERFENKFNYTISVEGSLDIHSTKIPALLLQPLVENAIEHGLFHKSEVGNLRVVFRAATKGFVQCIVDDDGVGRKKSKQLSSGSLVKKESFGDTLVKDLINIFNKYEKIKISIDYFDKVAPETGTIVTVNIKYP